MLFALRAFILWHNVNKVLTENTPLSRIHHATLFFALKVQHNLAQGKHIVCAAPWVNTAFPLYAPCKGNTLKSNVLHDVPPHFAIDRPKSGTLLYFITDSYNASPMMTRNVTRHIDPNLYLCTSLFSNMDKQKATFVNPSTDCN